MANSKITPLRIIRILLLFLVIFLAKSILDKRKKNEPVKAQNSLEMQYQKPNTLNTLEKEAGWKLLWDGKTFNGWRAIYLNHFPESGWVIENQSLVCLGSDLPDSLRGGSIVTDRKYGSFELKLQFKITPRANSGIKYFVNENLKANLGHGLGLEYAILDDSNWPYDRPDYKRTCGSLYDMVRAPDDKPTRPLGEWNDAGIVVRGNHIEHWLNGMKVVEIEKGNARYRELLSQSKYRNIKGWGEVKEGNILLQDEGPRTEFRNIKIREFK